jgi:hypothetical protein
MRQRNPRGDGNPHNNGPNGRLSDLAGPPRGGRGGGQVYYTPSGRRTDHLRTAPYRSDSAIAQGRRTGPTPRPVHSPSRGPMPRQQIGGGGVMPGGGGGYNQPGSMRQTYQGGTSTHGAGMNDYYPGRPSYGPNPPQSRPVGYGAPASNPHNSYIGRPSFQTHPGYDPMGPASNPGGVPSLGPSPFK